MRVAILFRFAAWAAFCCSLAGGATLAAAAEPGGSYALISPQKAEALAHTTHRSRAAALRRADEVRERAPHARARLQIEGTLPHQGIYDESIEATKDFDAARDLALAGRVTGDARYSERAAAIVAAWVKEYRPSFNPIDETKLDRLMIAYDLLPPRTKAPLAGSMNRFLRALAEGYLARFATLEGRTSTNNWQSHRIKLVTLAAFALGDERLIARVRSAFRTQLADNIRPDGSTADFQERDAVHYAVFDLEPLALAALAAREHGDDWYHLKNPSGAGLEDALLWLKKYADGSATHEEFARSTVRFDAERRRAGMSGFSGRFEPKGAREVMMIAARLDPRFASTSKKLGWSTPLYDLVWPLGE